MSADIRLVAKAYLDKGWAVVPLVKGEKRASSSWQKKSYGPSDFGATDGIALKCGDPSNGLVDVDLDCAEAVIAAKRLLPPTGRVHGRPGKPDSHYWYICPNLKTTQFTDAPTSAAAGTAMLVEIRSTGGYTAVPPSGHPSGDLLAWSVERDPDSIEEKDLRDAVADVAIAALLARHWPSSGARHGMVGHFTGFMLGAGATEARVVRILRAACEAAGDPDIEDRVAFARGTALKHAAGERTTGGPKLAEAIGDPVVARLRAWLKCGDADAIDEMNATHFWVRMGKDDVIGREDDDSGPVFQKPRSLYTEYANRKIVTAVGDDGKPKITPLFQAWLESSQRRSFRKVVFAPPPHKAAEDDYNLWGGFAIQPKAGNCQLFVEHIHEIICSGSREHSEYLMNLLALTVQEPGTPSEVATVMRGPMGAGKGIFVRALTRIFGRRHSAHIDKASDLVGHFNGALSGKIVVFADEAFWAGDKREVSSIKRLITEPTLRIERKGMDSVEEDNHCHLFMAANEAWVVPAGMKERRFNVVEVSGARVGDFPYFAALKKEMDEGGLAAFLDLLLKRSIDRELLRKIPVSKALREQQSLSLPPFLEWWQDCLFEGRLGTLAWPEAVNWSPVAVIYEQYANWSSARKQRMLSKVEFGRQISKFLSPSAESKAVKIDGRVTRCVALFTVAKAREVFDAELGTPGDWPPEAHVEPRQQRFATSVE